MHHVWRYALDSRRHVILRKQLDLHLTPPPTKTSLKTGFRGVVVGRNTDVDRRCCPDRGGFLSWSGMQSVGQPVGRTDVARLAGGSVIVRDGVFLLESATAAEH
jgi:hypothetical protein